MLEVAYTSLLLEFTFLKTTPTLAFCLLVLSADKLCKQFGSNSRHIVGPIGTASANFVKLHGIKPRCTSRIYFDNKGDNMRLTLYNVTLMPQIPCKHNNKCNCSKTRGYK